MTTKKLAVKKLLVSGFAAVALSLSTGAFASVSAMGDNGHANGNSNNSVGSVHLGANHGVATNNNGGSGYGGGNVNIDQNVWVQIGNVVGGAVNITINFVNNIFS